MSANFTTWRSNAENEYASQPDKPSIAFSKAVTIGGYQRYTVDDTLSVKYESSPAKMDLIKRVLSSFGRGKSLLDIGSCTGLTQFVALEQGFERTVGIDLDTEYNRIVQSAREYLGIDDRTVETRYLKFDTDIHDKISETFDVVTMLAIIHWIYSCTAGFGDLRRIVEVVKSMANNLVIEWVEPTDIACESLGHLKRSTSIDGEKYSKTELLGGLHDCFEEVVEMSYGYQSRPIMVCRTPTVWVQISDTEHSAVYRSGNVVKKVVKTFLDRQICEREAFWYARLKERGCDCVADFLYNDLSRNTVYAAYAGRTITREEALCQYDAVKELYEKITRVNCVYLDWTESNICTNGGKLYIIDLPWCAMLTEDGELDLSCNGAFEPQDEKPCGNVLFEQFREKLFY